MDTETIRDFYGVIIGYVETDKRTGNKTFRNFQRVILGYYFKDRNVTTDFYQRIVARGDAGTGLITAAEQERLAKEKALRH